MGMHQKIAISKQLQTHFKAKREKGVGPPFPCVPAPLDLEDESFHYPVELRRFLTLSCWVKRFIRQLNIFVKFWVPLLLCNVDF